MDRVIGQRWEIYDFEKVKNEIIKKGEKVIIKGTPDDFKEAVIELISPAKDCKIKDLYNDWKNGAWSPFRTVAAQDTIDDEIRQSIAAEAQEREAADQSLQEQINILSPEGLENLPELLAHKAAIDSPEFTGIPRVPGKTAVAINDGTLIATEAQVYRAVANGAYSGGIEYSGGTVRLQMTRLGIIQNDIGYAVGTYLLAKLIYNTEIIFTNTRIYPTIYRPTQCERFYSRIEAYESVQSGSSTKQLLSGTWILAGTHKIDNNNLLALIRRVS
jgi:hypothetical protein